MKQRTTNVAERTPRRRPNPDEAEESDNPGPSTTTHDEIDRAFRKLIDKSPDGSVIRESLMDAHVEWLARVSRDTPPYRSAEAALRSTLLHCAGGSGGVIALNWARVAVLAGGGAQVVFLPRDAASAAWVLRAQPDKSTLLLALALDIVSADDEHELRAAIASSLVVESEEDGIWTTGGKPNVVESLADLASIIQSLYPERAAEGRILALKRATDLLIEVRLRDREAMQSAVDDVKAKTETVKSEVSTTATPKSTSLEALFQSVLSTIGEVARWVQ